MRWWIKFGVFCAATSATAQTVIDGSDKPLSDPLIQKALIIISSDMKDPVSSQFRNLRFGKNNNILCGEINSKNGYGGYVGFMPFMHALGSKTAIVITENSQDNLDKNFRKLKSDWFKRDGCLP